MYLIMEYIYCDILTGKRRMLGNAISDLNKEAKNLSCYTIYDILKIVTFGFLNCTLWIQWASLSPQNFTDLIDVTQS